MGGSIGGFVENVTGINMGDDSAADQAIGAQTGAAREANATQRYIFDQQREDAQPWREAGRGALGGMQNADFQRDFTAEDFQADPGYAFRMAEGAKALERSAAARGGMNSGRMMKELTRFGQDTASAEYNNAYNRFNADRDRRFNRLSSIAGVGQTANSQIAAAGQNYGNNVSQNQIGLGNAIGAAHIAQGNRQADFLGQGVSTGMTAAMMFSDRLLKTNIKSVSKEDLAEMRAHIKAYRFNYISPEFGEGDWIGVMAQDLEKSELGRTLIVHDEFGNKQIDMRKAVSLFLATMAEE